MFDNGDALFGFGSGPEWLLALPHADAGAMAASLRRGLPPRAGNKGAGGEYVATFNEGEKSETFRSKDPAPFAEVFERLRTAAKNGACSRQTAIAIGELWDEHPPTPLSKPWYDKGERPVLRARAVRTAGRNSAPMEIIAVIKEDGSAYGGLWGFAWFPPKTFDADAMLRRLKPRLSQDRPRVEPGGSLYMASIMDRERMVTLYAHDSQPIVQVFEALRDACRQGKGEDCKQLQDAWRTFTPDVLPSAWDQK